MQFNSAIFFNALDNTQPRILVSACLLGQNVRYDGQPRHFPAIAGFFTAHANITPICPETAIGLAVPRPPVQLVEDTQAIHVRGVKESQLDITHPLAGFARKTAGQYRNHFQACILKSRSPSCGVSSTPVFNRANEIVRHGKGVVAEQLSQEWPNTIFIEEEQLACEPQRIELLLRCYMLLDIAMTADEQLPLLLGHYARLLNREPGLQALLALLTSQPLPLQANGNIVPS